MIHELFDAIDEMSLKFKISSEFKFLIFGDFIFSQIAKDTKDPSDLFAKIERGLFIKMIEVRALINETFGLDPQEYVKLHKHLLLAFRYRKILKNSTIRTQKDGV